jgi:ribonuclease HI
MIVAAFDGSCDPNPGGICTYGFAVRRDGALLHAGRGLAAPRGPGATNNVAEYAGALRALEWLDAQGLREGVILRGDSELVVRQLTGVYRVKSPLLAPLHAAASALMEKFPGLRVEWVPRARNAEADRLSKPA